MSRTNSLTIAAIFLVCLLLVTTTVVQAADASDKAKDKQEKTKTKPEKDKDAKDKQIEKAKDAIRNAEDAISSAENRISEAESAGLDVSDAKDALNEGKTLLREARSLLDTDPQRASSLANRAENMARLAANLAEQASRKEKSGEENVRKCQELIDETRGIIEKARIAIEETARIGGKVSDAVQILEQAENLLRNAESELGRDIGEAIRLATQARIMAEKALRISEKIMDEAKSMLELRARVREAEELINQAQEAIRNAEGKLQSVDLDENSHRILNEMLQQARDMLEKAREKLSVNPDSARAHADIALRLANNVCERIEERLRSRVAPRPGPELNLSINGDMFSNGEKYRIENRLQFTNGLLTMYMEKRLEKRIENGTTSIEIIREKVVVIDNKTLIEHVRILEKNGEVVEERELTEELNEPATASILEVKQSEINITKIDAAVRVEALHRDEERLRLRVVGPDGLGARILVIQIDADAFRAIESGDLQVLVNDAEARMADSVYQLLTGEVEEPSYVLVRTATGYQVMVYFPHFSEYIVEIRAILSRVLESLFNSQTALLATTAATLVVASVMALNMYRRYSSRGRVLKLW